MTLDEFRAKALERDMLAYASHGTLVVLLRNGHVPRHHAQRVAEIVEQYERLTAEIDAATGAANENAA